MARKLLIPLSAAVAGALIAAAPAAAATVTDCNDLQDALTEETTVTLAQGLICTGSWDLPSEHAITLEGAGTGATLRGDGESRILNGFDHGGIVIRNLSFTGGDTTGAGGALYASGFAPVTIVDSAFTGNTARDEGGAVRIEEQIPSLARTDGRTAQGAEGDRVTITGSTFGGAGEDDTNRSSSNGGGLAVTVSGPVTLADNVFQGNRAVGFGGGADVSFCGTAAVTGNTFEDNEVETRAVQGREAAGIIGGSAVGGGLSIEGFGCFRGTSRNTLEAAPEPDLIDQSGNVFRSNDLRTGIEGIGSGAGEYTSFAELRSTDDTFHANTISDDATGTGGGLFVDEARGAVLRNAVVTANRMSSGRGGGVAFSGFGGTTLSIVHATIAGNDVGDGEGSGIHGGSGQALTVDNSIVHSNTGGPEISGFEPFSDDRVAAGASAGGIDIAFSDVCAEGGQPAVGEGNICADPKLANAAGGDVHQTSASPTLERASATLTGELAKDYEGDARKLDYDKANGAQPDMGADEAPAPADKPATTTPPTTPAAGGVLGTQARSCTSRRTFKIKLRNRGQKVVKATVIVNGKRVKVLRGKRLTSRVDLRGLPKGRFSVRIKLELANGKTISGVRRYYTCRPGRRSGPPPV